MLTHATHGTTWINLTNMLYEGSQSQKAACFMIGNVWNRQIYGDRKLLNGYVGFRGDGKGTE